MNRLAGWSEAFQQICQRTFNVLFVTSQALFSPNDPGKRKKDQ